MGDLHEKYAILLRIYDHPPVQAGNNPPATASAPLCPLQAPALYQTVEGSPNIRNWGRVTSSPSISAPLTRYRVARIFEHSHQNTLLSRYAMAAVGKVPAIPGGLRGVSEASHPCCAFRPTEAREDALRSFG